METGINIAVAAPYGKINFFPAISPLLIMTLAYLAEALIGDRIQDTVHQMIVVVATIFTYGAIPLSLLSYLSFKYILLPVLNALPLRLHIGSYLVNTCILLVATGILSVVLLAALWGAGHPDRLIEAALLPTMLVGVNCFGHIGVFKLQTKIR